eukprot:COSAG01_NODE_55529_length_324_cov_1.128889_1_plen_80_part_00
MSSTEAVTEIPLRFYPFRRAHLQGDEGLLGLVVGEEGADVRLVVLGVAPAPGFGGARLTIAAQDGLLSRSEPNVKGIEP